MNQKLVSLSNINYLIFWSGRNLIHLLVDIFFIKPMLKDLCLEENQQTIKLHST